MKSISQEEVVVNLRVIAF